MGQTIKIQSANSTNFRVLAVSSTHIKCAVSEIEFLEHENKKFKIEKNEAGLSIFWQWKEGEPFPYAMAKLSAAKITPVVLKDFKIQKIYFFLVTEAEDETK